jgi:prophage antirepressor-like protein
MSGNKNSNALPSDEAMAVGEAVPVSALALQAFHKDFGEHQAELTASIVKGEPWFRGKEAAAALGYKNLRQAIRNNVDEEDRATMQNLRGLPSSPLSNANEGACVYISESGLYSLIMSSKLAHAKAFKRWVLKEVLPSIRRTGSYSGQANLEDDDEEAQEELEEESAVTVATPIPTEAQHWECLRAKLDALTAAHTLAKAAGVLTGEGLQKAITDGVNSVMLPAGRQQADMVDAAEFLQRKGHAPEQIARLASEFGRALKAAWEQTRGTDVVTNAEEFGFAANNVRKYHAQEDAVFLEEVYTVFKANRALYRTVCSAYEESRAQTAIEVSAALQNARGFKQPTQKRRRVAHRA